VSSLHWQRKKLEADGHTFIRNELWFINVTLQIYTTGKLTAVGLLGPNTLQMKQGILRIRETEVQVLFMYQNLLI
jgi:hypothetical protein